MPLVGPVRGRFGARPPLDDRPLLVVRAGAVARVALARPPLVGPERGGTRLAVPAGLGAVRVHRPAPGLGRVRVGLGARGSLPARRSVMTPVRLPAWRSVVTPARLAARRPVVAPVARLAEVLVPAVRRASHPGIAAAIEALVPPTGHFLVAPVGRTPQVGLPPIRPPVEGRIPPPVEGGLAPATEPGLPAILERRITPAVERRVPPAVERRLAPVRRAVRR
ncbi:hypothetical protein AB0F68_11955 [Micromonospora sp. NPDC023966]|uniref:hypothetical protein n=1 Tax=Micromonospora sp. NPDC023966 TaxID=3154699 RepID=UPI0033E21AA3